MVGILWNSSDFFEFFGNLLGFGIFLVFWNISDFLNFWNGKSEDSCPLIEILRSIQFYGLFLNHWLQKKINLTKKSLESIFCSLSESRRSSSCTILNQISRARTVQGCVHPFVETYILNGFFSEKVSLI